MNILKGYVKNPYPPKVPIVERYIDEETIEFCTTYMSEVYDIGVRHKRCKGGSKRST